MTEADPETKSPFSFCPLSHLPSFETDLANPTPAVYVVMAAAFLFHLAVIIFAGRSIVNFAVAHGIILSW
jgi:hypothetical protein